MQMFLNHSILNRSDEYIQNNLVELHIYLNQHIIEYINEQPAYELNALASDLGGVRMVCARKYLGSHFVSVLFSPVFLSSQAHTRPQVIGLYLGLAVVSAVEMFETICLLVYVRLMQLRGLNIQNSTTNVCFLSSFYVNSKILQTYKMSKKYEKKTVHEIIEEIEEKHHAENVQLRKEMDELKEMIQIRQRLIE
jgi:hypothetical protein